MFSKGRGSCNPRGGGNSGGYGHGDFSNKPRNEFPPCQLCGKTNHLVFKCYKRFDPNCMGEEESANATNSYGVDSNWYADLGATDHVTGENDKWAVRTRTMAMIKYTLPMVQVCALIMLVNLSFILHIVILCYTMFFMFSKPWRILL
jgi:hypothetical protein